MTILWSGGPKTKFSRKPSNNLSFIFGHINPLVLVTITILFDSGSEPPEYNYIAEGALPQKVIK